VTLSSKFGKQTDVFNGFDVVVNARPRPGLLIQGGTSSERRSTNNCDLVAQVPEAGVEAGAIVTRANFGTNGSSVPRQFCDAPGTFQTQLKLLGSFVIPVIDVQASASLQNLPGPELSANYIVPNATVARTLGRSLASGANSVTVSLIEPRTMFGDRSNQLDLRFAKILRFGRTRANIGVDVYNALNSNDVLTVSSAFATWQRPQSILNARFVKFVAQVDF
jgi:hypothetical protein